MFKMVKNGEKENEFFRLEALLQEAGEYMQYMESDEGELTDEELNLVAAAGKQLDFHDFLRGLDDK